MIIVEGLDNTGKTTLINTLVTVFPMLKLHKFHNVSNGSDEEYTDYIWDALGKSKRQSDFMIYDRFLFSELVYGPILRNRIRLRQSEQVAALRLLQAHKPLIIYCSRTKEQIMETFSEREQLSGVEENIIPLQRSYDTWLRGWDPIVYDYGHPRGLTKVVGAVADYIRKIYGLSIYHEEDELA